MIESRDDLSRIQQEQFRRRPSAYRINASAFDKKFQGFLISASGAGRDDRVLEVACGTGATTMAFAERCSSAVGLDLVAEPLARARAEAAERGLGNASFTLGEVERMPLGAGTFTGVVCRFSFHHFVHPERVFAEMARVVGPSGWIVIADMVASEDAAKAALHNELERLCDPTHARTLAASEYEQMFEQHGFRTAMKVARESRLSFDDWLGFNQPPPAAAARLRREIEASVDTDRLGFKVVRDGEAIRLTHTSISFVIERA